MGFRPSSSSAAAVLLLIIAEETLVPFYSLILISFGSPFFILGIARCVGTLSATGTASLASKLFPGRSTRLLGIIVAIASLVALAGTPAFGPDITHCNQLAHNSKKELPSTVRGASITTTTTTSKSVDTTTHLPHTTWKPIQITNRAWIVPPPPNFRNSLTTKSPETIYADSIDWGKIRTLIWPPPNPPPTKPTPTSTTPDRHFPNLSSRFHPHKLSSAEIVHRSPWSNQPRPYGPLKPRRKKIPQMKPIQPWTMENHRNTLSNQLGLDHSKMRKPNHQSPIWQHPRRFKKSAHFSKRRLLSINLLSQPDVEEDVKIDSFEDSFGLLKNFKMSSIVVPVCLLVIVEAFLVLALEACSSASWTFNPLAHLVWLGTAFPVIFITSTYWPEVCSSSNLSTMHSVVATGTLILALVCSFFSGDNNYIILKSPVVEELIIDFSSNVERFRIGYHVEQFLSSIAFSVLGELYLVHLALNETDISFPYNYEKLYCGYMAISMLARNGACRVPGVSSLPSWLGLCFVSVHLAVAAWGFTPAAFALLLAPLRGLAEASRISKQKTRPPISWSVGYASGCFTGGWTVVYFGLPAVLWGGAGLAALCSIGQLFTIWSVSDNPVSVFRGKGSEMYHNENLI